LNAGYGKIKGGNFEREMARALSLWITDGQNPNTLWRSAMSGGRSTLARKKGEVNKYQSGDLSAISPEAYSYVENVYTELKFYSQLGIEKFLLGLPSKLTEFWKETLDQATYHNQLPVLIAKQNRFAPLFISTSRCLDFFSVQISHTFTEVRQLEGTEPVVVMLLDDFLKKHKLNSYYLSIRQESCNIRPESIK
jgi:hypothetical protein